MKEQVLEAVRELPDEAKGDEIAKTVQFVTGVQEGFEQLDRGEGIPLDEVKKQLDEWLGQ